MAQIAIGCRIRAATYDLYFGSMMPPLCFNVQNAAVLAEGAHFTACRFM